MRIPTATVGGVRYIIKKPTNYVSRLSIIMMNKSNYSILPNKMLSNYMTSAKRFTLF